MPCTEAQLRTAKKWRDNNRERFKEIYTKSKTDNMEAVRFREKIRKRFERQCKIFRYILLE